MLAVTIVIAGVGASAFIVVGVRWASMQKLLRQGEYAGKEKKKHGLCEAVGFAYWGVLTAIYLTWSFLADHWHISWIVFAVGAVIFPAVTKICESIADKRNI